MNPEFEKMHKVWDGLIIGNKNPGQLSKLNFDEIKSSIFSTGLFYYYLIDCFDMSISNVSSGFSIAHGIKPGQVKDINDILALIHPDDMEFIAKAEEKSYGFLHSNIEPEKFLSYKVSYNFRARTAAGNYELFNHQALILAMDENYKFTKSLNVQTNIHHLTKTNNHKFSLLGLGDEPSYLNMNVFDLLPGSLNRGDGDHIFSKREVEIIKLISEGYSTRDIADKLFIALDTVETHRKNIKNKSGCKNAPELIARSLSEGWI